MSAIGKVTAASVSRANAMRLREYRWCDSSRRSSDRAANATRSVLATGTCTTMPRGSVTWATVTGLSAMARVALASDHADQA
jgi:hypothetical protein